MHAHSLLRAYATMLLLTTLPAIWRATFNVTRQKKQPARHLSYNLLVASFAKKVGALH